MQLDLPRPQFLGTLPAGEAGTRATLRVMRDLVRRYKRADPIRRTALELTAALQPKNWMQEVRAVFSFVRDRIRYTRDVRGVETVQTPIATLELEQGDCDDKATLLAALLESIGHPTRFVAVGYRSPTEFSHVYVETRIGPRWIGLDATMPYEVGWTPPLGLARMIVYN
ncbi:MAG: transglutaminase-like domain-containing protein [Gammaproteobacteria bacterium]|nr:transglutaminase-like domain-containing protein [Gammaproteobacteria bacterium]